MQSIEPVSSPIAARKVSGFTYSLVDKLVLQSLSRRMANATVGRLHVTLPSGASETFGNSTLDVTARVYVRSYRVIPKVALRGPLGFAEAYIAGDLDTDSLIDVLNFFMDNEAALTSAANDFVSSGWVDRIYHRLRANTRAGSRRNIAAHYDLGNAFYKLWLDETLSYSSGVFVSSTSTLAEAQNEKNIRVLSALGVQAHHSVLEIGCGWGGLLELLGRTSARVTGITISHQQLQAARDRIQNAGLDKRVAVVWQDYRDTTEIFDRIASVEMIEAVGEANWPTYFRTISDRLRPDGKAVIQAITIREDLFANYRRNPDYIQRYVFPGGMLPTETAMEEHAKAANLTFEVIDTFGASYALTLAAWRRNFHIAWPQIALLGFDERFRRLWDYYLCYCQVGFERGSVNVGHYRFCKKSAT